MGLSWQGNYAHRRESRSSGHRWEVAELERPVVGLAARTVVSQIRKRRCVLLIIRPQLSDKWHDSRPPADFRKRRKGLRVKTSAKRWTRALALGACLMVSAI